MAETNSNRAQKVGRLLWYDPNLANNVMVNPEDLSIMVEFTTYKKKRSIIYAGERVNNTGGDSATIKFIEGSKVSESEQPSLTTRYTEAVTLEVMNGSKDNNEDFESLGIESIDIEFNTAFQPMIKIKFIDIRGQAILQQGNMSKYNVFFQLPYPIFNLKVKGFYGKTVNYCLHMQRWNASFNSTTGNFEIQADFLGYTYAVLTDMLLGLIRAAVRTKKGQQKLQNKIGEYGENSDLVLTIDEMLKRLVEFNYSAKKISEDDDSASQLQSYDTIFSNIDKLNNAITNLKSSIELDSYFNDLNYVCALNNTDKRDLFKKSHTEYIEIITPIINSTNGLISDFNLKLDENILKNDIILVKNITKKILSSGNKQTTIKARAKKISGAEAYDCDECTQNINQMLASIGNLNTKNINENIEFDIYDFKNLIDYLTNQKIKLEDLKTKTEQNLASTISDIADETLGFEPTIRNIFRVLCINTEIFLEVLKEVSSEAELNEVRKNEFIKILSSSNGLNINKKDIEAKSIYPWPEYREDKKDKNNTGFVEAWLGAASGVNGNNINEVAFTNEMHTELLNVAKFDKDLGEEIANREAGLDVDSNEIKDKWYPISVADTSIDPRMTENPYILVSQSLIPEEVDRLVFMRIFLLLGISTYNNKLNTDLIKTIGMFEAENFLSACRKLGQNGKTLMNEFLNRYNTTDISDIITKTIIDFGLKGSNKIKNPNNLKTKPIMVSVNKKNIEINNNNNNNNNNNVLNLINLLNPNPLSQSQTNITSLNNVSVNSNLDITEIYYKYTYIINEGTKSSYIPVNKHFDGAPFYNNNNFIDINDLKQLSNDTIFVSNPKNWGVSRFSKNDDGSLHVKIYNDSFYNTGGMIPSFGDDLKTQFLEIAQKTPYLRVASSYGTLIETGRTNENITLQGVQPYISRYSTTEFSSLDYQDTDRVVEFYKNTGESYWTLSSSPINTTLIAFYTQYLSEKSGLPAVGTYLSSINSKLNEKLNQGNDNGFRIKKNNTDVIQFNSNLNKSKITAENLLTSTESNVRGIWLENGDYMKNKKLIASNKKFNTNIYLPFIEYGATSFEADKLSTKYDNTGDMTISLFGSYFYYLQTTDEAKALLFLHTIPWQGVKTFGNDISEFLMFDKHKDWVNKSEHKGGFKHKEVDIDSNKVTRVLSIKTLFQGNGGFIHAPKAWVLFIGGILWRFEKEFDPIKFVRKNGNFNDEIKYTSIRLRPSKESYMYMVSSLSLNNSYAERNPWGMFFGNDKEGDQNNNYVTIDKTLRNLPKQVKNEFINYFSDWVNSEDGFQLIKKDLELFDSNLYDGNRDKWFNDYDKLNKELKTSGDKSYITLSVLNGVFGENVVNNYEMIAPSPDLRGNYNTIFRPNTTVMDSIVSLLITPTIIQNVNPNIWHYDYYDSINDTNEALYAGYEENSPSKAIRVRADKFRSFLFGFYERLFKENEKFQKEDIQSEDDQTEQEIFGTSDDKTIKLQIYRKLSAINDKWLNGSAGTSIFSQCGGGVNEAHLKVGKKFRTTATDTTLIDTFRFVDRSFTDIGDKFYIDINQVNNLIRGNYNQSFFDVANKILADNNFNFIPLPNFVNFNDANELEQVFSAYSYNDIVNFTGTGPSFLCTYVGQTSTNLDLGDDSAYPDDGLSFNLNSDGSVVIPEKAEDFKEVAIIENGDMNVPVFAVNYGQQNQNYFKNVKLDQREFAETMESLEIIEDISQTGDKSKPTYAGNNLFSVYQTRSYSAEIEMMGSAMIQPMMYFQLNNIPMFRGAYLIYKVNHKITPHNMVTTFKGNRVKKPKTPLLDKATMYMNLVGTQVGGAPVSSRVPNSAQPIVKTLIDNGVRNAYINFGETYGQITTKKISEGTYFSIGSPKENRYMITEAANALVKMLEDWGKWMESNGFKKNQNGKYINIGSLYRDYATQAGLASGQKTAAAAGTSYHGWGLAVDMSWVNKNGTMLKFDYSGGSKPQEFNFDTNPALKWLYDNSYDYGFINPNWARDGSGYDEVWHWEYHGKSAKCLIRKDKVVKPNGYVIPVDSSPYYNSVVKNPKTPDGAEAVYGENCDYIKIKKRDGNVDGLTAENKSTKINDSQKGENQVKTKNYFKKLGLSKFAVAGIMGNIQKESTFNPLAVNAKDSNGFPSAGLIQWNGKFTPKGSTKDSNTILNTVGRTVETQLDYLVNNSSGYKQYTNKMVELRTSGENITPSIAAYWFAKLVERCAGCTGSYDDFISGQAKTRAQYAEDIYSRFNDDSDKLSW